MGAIVACGSGRGTDTGLGLRATTGAWLSDWPNSPDAV